MNVRHYADHRIVYIAEEPYFNGIFKLRDKQIRKILWGRWKNLSDEQIIKKLKKSVLTNINRIKYHLGNKDILSDDKDAADIIRTRLAVIEDIISGLRKQKVGLKKELEMSVCMRMKDVDAGMSEGYNSNNGS